MSRIFEALQRSESERVEFAFPEPPSVAMLDAAQKESPETEAGEVKPDLQMGDFPTVEVAPTLDSRLVSLTDKESLGAEKFRFLGVRLRQLQQERSAKKAVDYQHHLRGRQNHGKRQPGSHTGSPQTTEGAAAGGRPAASHPSPALWRNPAGWPQRVAAGPEAVPWAISITWMVRDSG